MSMAQVKSSLLSTIIKRNGAVVPFNALKIERAVEKAMKATGNYVDTVPKKITANVLEKIEKICQADSSFEVTVEHVQDFVELALMESDYHNVAKAYILYRDYRAQLRKRDIFKKRINLKPHEYPELLEYVDAIRHSYWIHTEFNFTSDIQDFKVGITPIERSAIKNTMLAISQIEVAVKTFWGHMYDKIPKPEIGAIGATFAESEVRHHDAYSHLLEILGLNEEFKNLSSNSVIMERVNYLETALRNARSEDRREYAESVLLFSLFIEHVSLFSQFLIIM